MQLKIVHLKEVPPSVLDTDVVFGKEGSISRLKHNLLTPKTSISKGIFYQIEDADHAEW
jgi:hypothetical protein